MFICYRNRAFVRLRIYKHHQSCVQNLLEILRSIKKFTTENY